jgi:hypothetical protein
MSVLYVRDASSVGAGLVYRPAMVSYDVAYFYLVWPALLQEILDYCYINKEYINFITGQCKPHHK